MWDEAGGDDPLTLANLYVQCAVLVKHVDVVDTHQYIIIPGWQLPFRS